LYGYFVVDKPWFIAPAVVPLKADPDQMEVCEWEKKVWEDVKSGEDLEEMRGGIYKGVLVETDIDEGLQGVQTDWPAIW